MNNLTIEMQEDDKKSIGYFTNGVREGLSLFFGDKEDLRLYKNGNIDTYYCIPDN